jgi:hypothetical protein
MLLFDKYSNIGMDRLFIGFNPPLMTKYFILYPYLGTIIGSIFYNLLAASPCPGQVLSPYFKSFTSLAKEN